MIQVRQERKGGTLEQASLVQQKTKKVNKVVSPIVKKKEPPS